MRQRTHVSDHASLAPERCDDAFARVVGPVLHCHGPLHHGADALTHPAGRLRFLVPDGGEHAEDVGARDLGDGALAKPREHEALETGGPVVRVLRIAPSGAFLLQHACGCVGERRDFLGAALLGERVAALACDLPVGERPGPRLPQRDEREPTEAKLASPAADHESLDPAPVAGRSHFQVQSLPVGVAAGFGDGAHECGRKGVLGVTAVGLGSSLSLRVWHHLPL